MKTYSTDRRDRTFPKQEVVEGIFENDVPNFLVRFSKARYDVARREVPSMTLLSVLGTRSFPSMIAFESIARRKPKS